MEQQQPETLSRWSATNTLNIGSVPSPRDWAHWKAAETLLEPARKLGGFEAVIEPDEALWAVMDGDNLLACATAWLEGEICEVKLVGGRDHRRWLEPLDKVIGAAARDAGATRLQAFGRRGWTKVLCAIGWDRLGEADGMTIYRREL